MTQADRLQIERERSQRAERIARLNAAAQAATAQRGNTTVQLTALRDILQSYDKEAAEIRDRITAAERSYNDEGAASLQADLEGITRQAQAIRDQIGALYGPKTPPRAPAPAPGAGAPRPAAPRPGARTVPPPVRRP